MHTSLQLYIFSGSTALKPIRQRETAGWAAHAFLSEGKKKVFEKLESLPAPAPTLQN
jgi:hypothetical protein